MSNIIHPALGWTVAVVGLCLGIPALVLSLAAGRGREAVIWEAGARAASPQSASSAQQLFCKRCESCHGKDGSGRKMRENFSTIPDFRSGEWQQKRKDSQLLVSILDGKGTNMPAFEAKITKDQARQLVTYVRSFGPKRPKPSRASRPFGPTRATSATRFEADFLERFQQLQEEFDRIDQELRRLTRPRVRP
jgi:mono/diheme cytochrome c family protein